MSEQAMADLLTKPAGKLSEQTPAPPPTVPELEIQEAEIDPIGRSAPDGDLKFDLSKFKKDEEDEAPQKGKDEATEKQLKAEEAKAAAKQPEVVDSEKEEDADKDANNADNKTDETKSTDFKVGPIVSKRQERDYTGLDEKTIELLKKSSNETFEFARSKLKELDEAKGRVKELEEKIKSTSREDLPESYYEHPRSYLLDDRYHKAIETADRVVKEVSHWEQQNTKIENGEKWIDIVGWDPQTGKYQLVEREPSIEARNYINRKIMQGDAMVRENATIAQQLETQSSLRGETLRKAIVEKENFLFPDLKDPKLYETNQFMKGMKAYLSEGGLGNNALLPIVCKMYAKLVEAQTELEEERKTKKVEKVEEKVKEAAGPSSGEINKGTGDTKVPKSVNEMGFDINAFKKVKGEE